MMPFYITPKTLTKQAKTLVKHWSYERLKLTKAREILCQLYGYKSNHHYKQLEVQKGLTLPSISQDVVFLNYRRWIQKLANLGSLNETQSKKMLHLLWNNYLNDNVKIPKYLYTATFTFYGECNDLLDESSLEYPFNDNPSVKDAIEALGLPHVEVGAIVVNGENVDFEHTLNEHDRVEVFSHNIVTSKMKALPFKPKELTFLLDVHLGTLARYLRMAGFNTLYETKDYGDAFLAELASDSLIMLSRDIGLLKRGKVKYGRWVRNVDPERQFKEIVKTYKLQKSFNPFSRCLKCNGEIHIVPKASIEGRVPPKVYEWCDEFRACNGCSQVYWKGSHYEKMVKMMEVYDV